MASCLRAISSSSSRSSSILKSSQYWGRRSLHRRRELPYRVEDGLGKFLPPPALQTLVEYQDGLLERLNNELRTDPKGEGHASVAQVVIDYAEKRERTLAFNYATLALNNSFFLDQLSPPPSDSSKSTHESAIKPDLDNQIHVHYTDVAHLKSTFSAAALGMFSSGWVWLVTDQDGNLGVLPTYGPSTLLVRSRMNMHYDPKSGVLGEDADAAKFANQPSMPTAHDFGIPPPPKSFNYQLRTIHSTSRVSIGENEHLTQPEELSMLSYNAPLSPKSSLMSVGKTIFPLFCLPVYEHTWMSAGFGIWGKEAWLKEFWTVLDWNKVSLAYANRGSLSRNT